VVWRCLPGGAGGSLILMGLFVKLSIVRRLFVGVLAFGGVCAWGQGLASVAVPGKDAPKVTVVEPPVPLLPTNAQLVPDTAGAVPAATPEFQAILKEDGLVRSESRTIEGSTGAWVEAYQFGDATGAYSAYTYLRQGGRAFGGSGRVNATEVQLPSGETVYLSGVTVVRALAKQHPEVVGALLKSVEVGLPKIGGRKGLAPLLPKMLPKDGLDAASVRYALGPVAYQAMGGVLPASMLSWDKSAESATASYSGRGVSKGTLTLLMYPTPQIAGDRGRAIEKEVNDEGVAKFGTLKMRRVGPLLGITSGALSAAQAENLIAGLHLSEEVTFDKKMPLEFHAEVKKTASLLQNIAVLCGVLILAAVLLVMHGKPAASEPEFLTISLRDSPKALFAPKEPERELPAD
jgi:hypothetical protein